MRSSPSFIDKLASGLFRAQARAARTPHPLFEELYERVHVALDEAELCLHAEVTSRPNLLEIFFDFDTWSRFVAARQTHVHAALEAEIEAHRSRAGYGDDERIVLRLFVADPAQLEVQPDHPEVIARRVPDPLAVDARWESALKHTTIIGRGMRAFTGTRPFSAGPLDTALGLQPASTAPTPIAVLTFVELGEEQTRELFAAGIFGRGSGSDVQVHPDPLAESDPAEVVSRRALELRTDPFTKLLEIHNLGRWPLEVPAAGAKIEPKAVLRVERGTELIWPGHGDRRFRVSVVAPRRGTLTLRSKDGEEQNVVLRAPRTNVVADPSIFGENGVAFNVDFVDGTGFLVLNNEGSVALRLGTLEGKQLQWPIDVAREIEAGELTISIALEEAK
jgi:hypothetical protein